MHGKYTYCSRVLDGLPGGNPSAGQFDPVNIHVQQASVKPALTGQLFFVQALIMHDFIFLRLLILFFTAAAIASSSRAFSRADVGLDWCQPVILMIS